MLQNQQRCFRGAESGPEPGPEHETTEISVHPAFPEKRLYVQLLHSFPPPQTSDILLPGLVDVSQGIVGSVVYLLISSLPVSRPLNQLWNEPARAF